MSGSNSEPQEDCAICFDAVAETTVLPCSCRVAYCGRCWDRALAQSFKACGQARCPSCRGPVRVDFDAEAAAGRGRLKFSRESEDHSYSRESEALQSQAVGEDIQQFVEARQRARVIAEARSQVIERLAEQASPVQRRLLERYGTEQPLLRAIMQDPQQALAKQSVAELKKRLQAMGGSAAGCTEKADLVSQLLSSAGSAPVLAARWAAGLVDASEVPPPECVCGGALARVSGRDRARRFLQSVRPNLAENSAIFQAMLEDYTSQGHCAVICDLCENSVISVDSGVWTCSNDDDTILHATSYDVCEDCFLRHALGVQDTPQPDAEDE